MLFPHKHTLLKAGVLQQSFVVVQLAAYGHLCRLFLHVVTVYCHQGAVPQTTCLQATLTCAVVGPSTSWSKVLTSGKTPPLPQPTSVHLMLYFLIFKVFLCLTHLWCMLLCLAWPAPPFSQSAFDLCPSSTRLGPFIVSYFSTIAFIYYLLQVPLEAQSQSLNNMTTLHYILKISK